MPTVRKVAPEVARSWDLLTSNEPVPIPANPRGLTRMDYPKSGSIGWMARVYHAGTTFTRYFSDARYGGPSGALRRAEIWRDEMRQRVEQRPAPPDQIRLVRVDRPEQKLVGWYVYVRVAGRRHRRYISDARHGGASSARHSAEQWASEITRLAGGDRAAHAAGP